MDADEYFNQLFPLGGNPGLVSKVTLDLSPTPTSIDIRRLFGNIDGGHALTLKADCPYAAGGSGFSWRAYFSFTPNAGNLAPVWSGAASVTPSGFQSWPLKDGDEFKGRMLVGRSVNTTTAPTGYATMLAHQVLNVACNIGSGLLHVMRSTLHPTQDSGQLRAPIGSAIYPPGPSGWNGPLP